MSHFHISCEPHRHLKVKEKSPLGRFVRFNRKLGSGSYKTVWLGFDNDTGADNLLQPLQLLPAACCQAWQGMEVAWNIISFQNLDKQLVC